MPLYARSGTLTPDTVTTVAITNAYPDGVTIVNRAQNGSVIWVRADGTNPVIGADDCFPVAGVLRVPSPTVGRGDVTIKLISDQAVPYTVHGAVPWAV